MGDLKEDTIRDFGEQWSAFRRIGGLITFAL